jgi:small-conductance mechanosensitive channel
MANYSYLWKVIASIVMVFNALPVLAQSGETPSEIETITTITNMIRPGGVVVSILVLFGVWLLLRFVDRLVTNLGSIFAERRLLLHKVNAFFHFIVYLAAIITVVLLSLKISREVMAILGGTAAVAMGFALKDLVASIVAGVMIMLDRPFQVGDRVSFGGQYGDITAIGLRSTKLQTLDDNTVTIPNNMFLNQITSCGNYGELDMQVVVDFHIGVDQNIRLAQDLVQEATVTSRYIYLPKPVTVGVSQVVINTCVTVRLRLKAYVLDTKFEKALVSDVTLRVLEAFKSQGIQPPAVLYRNIVDGHNSIQPRLVSTEKPS